MCWAEESGTTVGCEISGNFESRTGGPAIAILDRNTKTGSEIEFSNPIGHLRKSFRRWFCSCDVHVLRQVSCCRHVRENLGPGKLTTTVAERFMVPFELMSRKGWVSLMSEGLI